MYSRLDTTNYITRVDKIFPSFESLLNDGDHFKTTFIMFIKDHLMEWFPSQESLLWGNYFNSTDMMLNGVEKVIIRNFLKIANKFLVKNGSTPIKRVSK